MRRRLACLTILICLTTAACADPPQAQDGSAGAADIAADADAVDFEAVANVILGRLALQPGERVMLVGVPGRFDPLVPLLRQGVHDAAATDLGGFAEEGGFPPSWETDFIADLHEARDEQLPRMLSDVDAAVMLPGANPGHRAYAALQEVLRDGQGRTVHFHWAGAYNLDGTEREVDAMVDAFYTRVLVDTDYEALAADQREFEVAMRGGTVRVTTPAGTDVSFRIGDRPVTKQDGDASAARAAEARNLIDREIELPAGAIRVAPVETSVQGTVVFPPSVWSGESVEGLTLSFQDGVVTSIRAEAGEDAARAEIEAAGPAGRAFREFALGFNPLLAIPAEGERWIPHYGYGAGVVRLSLGDNTELGGNVGGGYVRWNFFVDATVTVDGEVWVEDGRLVR